MKILFLNPPFLNKFSREQRSPAVTKSGTIYYPMWLAYAAGYAEEFGNEVFLIDAPAENMELDNCVQRLQKNQFEPELAVIVTSTPSIYQDVESAVALKKEYPGLSKQ